jgi:ferredoxin
MHFAHLVEGPLLWVSFCVFFAAIVVRTTLFALSTFSSPRALDLGRRRTVTLFARALLPYHRVARKRPFYTFSLYLFHLCILVVPIWLYGHIIIWEDSPLGLSWRSLPDHWADRLTLLVLALVSCFTLRRLSFRQVRARSSFSHYLLLAMVALPFSSGYFLMHGTLEALAFFDDYMMTIHIFTAEATLVAAAFLFCKFRLDEKGCIGCAACEITCPTGALTAIEAGLARSFVFSHYPCLCCAACVDTCPEGAADLEHKFALRGLHQPLSRDAIREVELSACASCGAPHLPTPQIEKLESLLAGDFIHQCPACKNLLTAERLHSLHPRRTDPSLLSGKRHSIHQATSHLGRFPIQGLR